MNYKKYMRKSFLNVDSLFVYLSVISFLYDSSFAKKQRFRRYGILRVYNLTVNSCFINIINNRLNQLNNGMYVPSLIDFELKGKSLAWFPLKLGGEVEILNGKSKERKCRYIQEPNCYGTGKPKKIYDAQEDGCIGDGKGDDEKELDEEEYENEEEDEEGGIGVVGDSSTVMSTSQTTETQNNKEETQLADTTSTSRDKSSIENTKLTNDGIQSTETIGRTKTHSNVATLSITKGDENYYFYDLEEKDKLGKFMRTTKLNFMNTRLPHIETAPFPHRPLDLSFPTCSSLEDSLDIKLPNFANGKIKEKKKDKCRKRKRKTTHHTTTIATTFLITTNPNNISVNKISKKCSGNTNNEAKVLLRIPPNLAELPVVVLKDPNTEMLSLSVVGIDQNAPNQNNYYFQPPYYQQMMPPPFPYPNYYLPGYSPYRKELPYYPYAPQALYKKDNYLHPLNHKSQSYLNNLRWIRDVLYEDEDKRNISTTIRN